MDPSMLTMAATVALSRAAISRTRPTMHDSSSPRRLRRGLLAAALGVLAACHGEPTAPRALAVDPAVEAAAQRTPNPVAEGQTVVVVWSSACLQAIRTSK